MLVRVYSECMRRALRIGLFLCLLQTIAASEQITIATEEYPPYCSERLHEQGIDCYIVRQAFKRANIDVTFKFFPGARSYEMAETGQVVATLPWAKRKEREQHFIYSDAIIAVQPEHYFILKDKKDEWSKNLSDIQNIKGKRIGAIIGHNYGSVFQTAEKNKTITVTRVSKPKQAFQMLLLKRLDAVVCKRDVGDYELRHCASTTDQARIVNVPAQLNQASYDHMLFSKKHPDSKRLHQVFNSTLQEMHKDGSYKKIIADFERGAFGDKERQEP